MARFLVDASVWIEFLRGRLKPNVYSNLSEGIRLNLAVMTDIIRHEILVGAKDTPHFRELKGLFSHLEFLRVTDEELPAFEEFAWSLGRQGFLGKYTDASIAFLASRHRLPLLTFDRYFNLLARKGILQLIKF